MITWTCDRCGRSDDPVYQVGYKPHPGTPEWAPVNLDLCRECFDQVIADCKAHPKPDTAPTHGVTLSS